MVCLAPAAANANTAALRIPRLGDDHDDGRPGDHQQDDTGQNESGEMFG